MQTFKLFITLMKRNFMSVFIYFIIFVIIAVMTTNSGQTDEKKLYQDKEIAFTVINRDNSKTGEAIKEYLSEKNKFVEVKDNIDALRNELYYRGIYYALIIPEGFEAALYSKGELSEISLENYKVSDSSMGYYMDMMVEEYMVLIKAYIAAGYEHEEAVKKTNEVLTVSADIKFAYETKDNSDGMAGYYQTIPYIYMAMITLALGSVLLSFNEEKVRLRTMCSSLKLTSRNLQIALGTILYGAVIWLLFEIIAFVLYVDNTNLKIFIYNGINSFVFVITTVCLSVLFGFAAKKYSVLNALSVIFSLGTSFISGVFVPLEVLGSNIKNIAKLFPTYWYITAKNAILELGTNLSSARDAIFKGILIQLMFALVYFTAAMVASKKQKS